MYETQVKLENSEPHFPGKHDPHFYSSLLVQFTSCRLAKFG